MPLSKWEDEIERPDSNTLQEVAPELPTEEPVAETSMSTEEVTPAERDNQRIERTLRERLLARQAADEELQQLNQREPSEMYEKSPMAEAILASQKGWAKLAGGNTDTIDATLKRVQGVRGEENAARDSLRKRIMEKRQRTDEPLADLSLKSRLLGEARKERVGAATEGDEITKSGQEVKKIQQGLELGELNKTRMGQDITEGARKIGDEEQKREGASERSQTARTIISEGLRKEAAALRASGQRDLAARAETEANRIGGSELSEFDLEKYPIAGMSGKDFLADQRSRELSEENRKSREAATAIARQDKQAKTEMPSDKQTQTITDLDTAIEAIDFIAERKKGIDTGPVANKRNQAAKLIGVDDPKISAFRSDVQDQLSRYIRSMSGTAASNQERLFLMENIPNMTDNDETFNEKLKRFRMKMEQIRNRTVQNIGNQGKNVSNFQQSPTLEKSAPYGQRVERNGTMYIWNGSKYVREAK